MTYTRKELDDRRLINIQRELFRNRLIDHVFNVFLKAHVKSTPSAGGVK